MKPQVVNEYIMEALFRLMKKKSYTEISVKELVETAGVCRASFYRNYISLEAVVDAYLKTIFDHIRERNDRIGENIEEAVYCVFCDLLSEKERMLILNRQNLLYRLEPFVYDMVLSQQINFHMSVNRYQLDYCAGSTFAIIQAWIKNKFEETPEEMTKIYFDLLHLV